MIPRHLPLAAALAVLIAVPAHAADPEAGKKIVSQVCQACHGMDGNSKSPDYPRLAGQHPRYLAEALHEYKTGQRKNPIMAGFAAQLSPADIDNLAAYFAAQPAAVHDKY